MILSSSYLYNNRIVCDFLKAHLDSEMKVVRSHPKAPSFSVPEKAEDQILEDILGKKHEKDS